MSAPRCARSRPGRAFASAERRARIELRQPIPLCHKFALRAVAAGAPVVKYGETIGRASRDIAPGEHVHIHNLLSARAARS